jgi:serine/threonine-protein kinase
LLGFDTELAIYVAVKLPRQDLPNLESACNDLIKEASRAEQLTYGLRDCGVVRVRKLAWHNKVPAIVMDVVDGPDLGRVLKSRGGRLPPQEAVGLLKQLCRVLQHTHQKNCIHRDLKPQNLLLDERGVLWLTDFGLAQQEWERRTTDQLEGTIPYMSPEQWQCERLDGRTDVWSLGVIMYQMLSGQRPFQEPDIGDKIRKAWFSCPSR